MTPETTQQQILFEFDEPNTPTSPWLSSSGGVYQTPISNIIAGATDDYAVTGYYAFQQAIRYFVRSLIVDKFQYAEMVSLADCIITDKSFYFDQILSILYVHFVDGEPPLAKEIFIGYARGYSKNSANYFYNGWYYDQLISKVYPIKKSIDPLFYGLLKYQGGNVTLINTEGQYDDWRSRNLYGQACRVIIGDADAAYADLTTIGTGFIENDSRDFEQLTVTMQDPRKALTVSIALNNYTASDLVDPGDSNIDRAKPMAYGVNKNAPCVCLSDKNTPPTYPVFHFLDTTYHPAASVEQVYCNGEPFATVTTDLTSGTFTIAAAGVLKDGSTVGENLDGVTIDFTVAMTNGVDIIKDLLLNFDGKTYISSFFDIAEIDLAQLTARNTSLYIDKTMKLSEAIESICNDLDARFFCHDDGKYTIRLYSASRTPVKTIERDEWLSDPTFDNNGSEFLTSAVVRYSHDITNDKYSQTEYKAYEAAAYSRYKTLKKDTFSTNLLSSADATLKAANIMAFSAEVKDIITRSTHWAHSDIEICDFIVCDPSSRVNGTETKSLYEVIGISKDFEKLEIQLTLRYVSADPTIYYTYATRITSDGFDRITSDGDVRITREA